MQKIDTNKPMKNSKKAAELGEVYYDVACLFTFTNYKKMPYSIRKKVPNDKS